MRKRFRLVAIECLVDLGITVVYAVLVGVVVVAIFASDNGPISVLHAGLYAMLLPAAVLALIAAEIGLRLFQEWRAVRRTETSMLGLSRP